MDNISHRSWADSLPYVAFWIAIAIIFSVGFVSCSGTMRDEGLPAEIKCAGGYNPYYTKTSSKTVLRCIKAGDESDEN